MERPNLSEQTSPAATVRCCYCRGVNLEPHYRQVQKWHNTCTADVNGSWTIYDILPASRSRVVEHTTKHLTPPQGLFAASLGTPSSELGIPQPTRFFIWASSPERLSSPTRAAVSLL